MENPPICTHSFQRDGRPEPRMSRHPVPPTHPLAILFFVQQFSKTFCRCFLKILCQFSRVYSTKQTPHRVKDDDVVLVKVGLRSHGSDGWQKGEQVSGFELDDEVRLQSRERNAHRQRQNSSLDGHLKRTHLQLAHLLLLCTCKPVSHRVPDGD